MTPPFGLKQYNAINDRITAIETETGERLTRVETKVDIVIDLMRQEREDRSKALVETHKTERVAISTSGKVKMAAWGAIGTALGIAATVLVKALA